MTKDDQILLLHFITRTGMYIDPVDIHTVNSFITGYEIGRGGKCKFLELFKELLAGRYKIKYLNDGWPGQINRLSKKRSVPEIITFKRIAIETIFSGKISRKMGHLLIQRVTHLIDNIHESGRPWYGEPWRELWRSFVLIDQQWFKQLWSKEQLTIIRAIDKEVAGNKISKDHNTSSIPSTQMLKLKDRFVHLNNK